MTSLTAFDHVIHCMVDYDLNNNYSVGKKLCNAENILITCISCPLMQYQAYTHLTLWACLVIVNLLNSMHSRHDIIYSV